MSLFGKSAKELVYDVMVNANPELASKGVTSDQLAFGQPSHLGGPVDDPEQFTRLNTSLDVNGILEKGTFGKISLKYRRLDMGHLFADVVISVNGAGVTKSSDLVPLIREKYNLLISVDEVYPNESVSGVKHNLRFNGSSFAWTGSLEVYLDEVPSDGKDISKMITVTELEGLVYNIEDMGSAT